MSISSWKNPWYGVVSECHLWAWEPICHIKWPPRAPWLLVKVIFRKREHYNIIYPVICDWSQRGWSRQRDFGKKMLHPFFSPSMTICKSRVDHCFSRKGHYIQTWKYKKRFKATLNALNCKEWNSVFREKVTIIKCLILLLKFNTKVP